MDQNYFRISSIYKKYSYLFPKNIPSIKSFKKDGTGKNINWENYRKNQLNKNSGKDKIDYFEYCLRKNHPEDDVIREGLMLCCLKPENRKIYTNIYESIESEITEFSREEYENRKLSQVLSPDLVIINRHLFIEPGYANYHQLDKKLKFEFYKKVFPDVNVVGYYGKFNKNSLEDKKRIEAFLEHIYEIFPRYDDGEDWVRRNFDESNFFDNL